MTVLRGNKLYRCSDLADAIAGAAQFAHAGNSAQEWLEIITKVFSDRAYRKRVETEHCDLTYFAPEGVFKAVDQGFCEQVLWPHGALLVAREISGCICSLCAETYRDEYPTKGWAPAIDGLRFDRFVSPAYLGVVISGSWTISSICPACRTVVIRYMKFPKGRGRMDLDYRNPTNLSMALAHLTQTPEFHERVRVNRGNWDRVPYDLRRPQAA